MSNNIKNVAEDGLDKVEETLSKTEQFIEENQKIITIVVAIIIVAVGGYFAYKNFVIAPKEEAAKNDVWKAQYYFEIDSFNLALMGDESYLGFEDIADDYSMTSTGNLANYYAGICHLHLGNFEDAISYLSKFSGSDKYVAAIAKGAIGDANLELDNKEEAVKNYLAAAEIGTNDLVAPVYLMKAGAVYEALGQKEKALNAYKTIEKEYKGSQQARDIAKYIQRLN